MDVRTAVITANLGDFDNRIDPVEQSVPFDFFRFTDENFPPRYNAMTPRLQARIVKMFGWQMVPGYSVYIWVDSSMAMEHPDSVKWFIEQLGDADMAVFKHPHRRTILEEALYLKHRLNIKCPYITPRYENELIDEQMKEIDNDSLPLYASTAFAYRSTFYMKGLLKEWWYHTSRYHTIDQLSLPYVIEKSYCNVNVIPNNYLKCAYITPVRKRKENA